MNVARLHPEALLPTRKHPTDAGLDLAFCGWYDGSEYPYVNPQDVRIARTGITVEVPHDKFIWITNKSRSAFLLGGGIIDQYQGELMVKIFNPTNQHLRFFIGDLIAQIILLPLILEEANEVPLSEIHQKPTARGATGGILLGQP